MKEISRDFDTLHEWALMSDQELREIVSNETMRTLHRISSYFITEKELEKLTINEINFILIVRTMKNLLDEGSHALSMAIICAGDLLDNGQKNEAMAVYEQFCLECSSPFYRNIAESQIKKISDILKNT